MDVREAILDRDTSKILIIKSNGQELYNSNYHSYEIYKKYSECEVIEVFEGKTIFGINIKEINNNERE